MDFIESLNISEKGKQILRNSGLRSVRSMISYVMSNEEYFRSEIAGDVDVIYEAHKDVKATIPAPKPAGMLGFNLDKKV